MVGFVQKVFDDQQLKLRWEVDWDGFALPQPLRVRGNNWDVDIQGRYDRRGVFTIQVAGRHKKDPHGEAAAMQATFALQPNVILAQAVGPNEIERGRDRVIHRDIDDDPNHDDLFVVKTVRRNANVPGVTIVLYGEHAAKFPEKKGERKQEGRSDVESEETNEDTKPAKR